MRFNRSRIAFCVCKVEYMITKNTRPFTSRVLHSAFAKKNTQAPEIRDIMVAYSLVADCRSHINWSRITIRLYKEEYTTRNMRLACHVLWLCSGSSSIKEEYTNSIFILPLPSTRVFSPPLTHNSQNSIFAPHIY